MDDLISRRDAKSKKVYSNERHEYVIPVAELDWLPSAQPEIIRCNDCEYWQQFCNDVFGNCCFGHGVTVMEFYCRDGERRNK